MTPHRRALPLTEIVMALALFAWMFLGMASMLGEKLWWMIYLVF